MKKEDKIRMIMAAFAICCLTMCTILNIQIAIQKKQLQVSAYAQARIEKLQVEEMENLAYVKHENEVLSGTADQIVRDVRDFIKQYNGIKYEVQESRIENALLQSEYAKRLYLDRIVLELDEEKGSCDYMERYFQVDKESLEEFLSTLQWEEELAADFHEMERWGELLPVGDHVWNLYAADSSPESGPKGVLIQNPLIDFGYKEARAGMNLWDIKEKYPESGEEDKALSDGNFIYLQYTDERYRYYYVTIDYYSACTMLYVTHR